MRTPKATGASGRTGTFSASIQQFARSEEFPEGLYRFQSQVRDGVLTHAASASHWSVAPNMITSLADIAEYTYVVLPLGARPIFRPTSIDPGCTVSSRAMEAALTKHYGYVLVSGGKGSHIKLKKHGAPTIVFPGNRPVLSPGVVKQVLDGIGGYPLSSIPDVLNGKLLADFVEKGGAGSWGRCR